MYVIYIYKQESKKIMKKYKGQSLIEFGLITAIVFGIVVGSVITLGNSVADVFKDKNPAKTYNAKRTLQFENPQNIISNVPVTVGGFSVASPIEKIAKANLLSGNSSEKDSSVERLTEMAQVMQEYGVQIDAITRTLADTAARTNFLNALTAYSAVINATATKVTTPGVTDLEIKLALFNMAINLNPTGVLSNNLNAAFTAYIGTLDATKKKTAIINLFTTDLFNFAKSINCNVNNSVYVHELGVQRNNTFAQDQALVTQMIADFAGYTAQEIKEYTKKIKLSPDANYSTLAPDTYNDKTLCAALGGSGSPCAVGE